MPVLKVIGRCDRLLQNRTTRPEMHYRSQSGLPGRKVYFTRRFTHRAAAGPTRVDSACLGCL
jgi:hypothetical protein